MPKTGRAIRDDFPFYRNNPDPVFLDSAASSLTPRQVIDAVNFYYANYSVNIHRGLYEASLKATEHYEASREKVKKFLNADDSGDIIYVRNATEGINLIAHCLSQGNLVRALNAEAWAKPLRKGDVIIISESEHHANIVPWQIIAKKLSLEIQYIPVEKNTGALDLNSFDDMKKNLKDKTVKVVSLASTSNVTGIIHDLSPFKNYARSKGAMFIVDGAQSVCHTITDLKKLDPDFFVFSAHKMLGPTGIGVLWGKKEILRAFQPFLGGGEMILSVSKEKTIYKETPFKFEAGTPHIAGAFGLSAAIDYLQKIGMEAIADWEDRLTLYALEKLNELDLKIYGPSVQHIRSGTIKKAGVISFGVPAVHPHDIGTVLDTQRIAIRAGHHCCQILMEAWNISATARASLYLYNDFEDIDRLIEALIKVKKLLSPK